MSTEAQSIAAAIIVALAVVYIGQRWWRNRQRSASGCGEAGECACPAPNKPKFKAKTLSS